jgi:monoamine oxidase
MPMPPGCRPPRRSARPAKASAGERFSAGWPRPRCSRWRRGVARAGKPPPAVDVGIVGGGLAGLQCAYELGRAGLASTIYEASNRIGGRQFSLRGTFPGQAAERGGELIDNLHKTMLGWVNTLGLTREDITRSEGEELYYFDGRQISEATVVDEYRAFVAAMHADLRASSGAPTADAFNAADQALDRLSLADYLTSRGCGRYARKAIEEAYVAEYGREPGEQSALGFLLFIHADKRSKFTPFGIFSDERFHVVEGNDKIATGIAARLPRAPELGMKLEAVRKTSAGRIELTFRSGTRSVVRTHDKVVLAIPFSVLRTISLDASLQLPPWKRTAIDTLGYGDNAKLMLGFKGPYWGELGSTGGSYSDLTNHQTTWETSPTTATSEHAILTDYSGGVRGKNLSSNVQLEAGKFLGDLERVMPGAAANVPTAMPAAEAMLVANAVVADAAMAAALAVLADVAMAVALVALADVAMAVALAALADVAMAAALAALAAAAADAAMAAMPAVAAATAVAMPVADARVAVNAGDRDVRVVDRWEDAYGARRPLVDRRPRPPRSCDRRARSRSPR